MQETTSTIDSRFDAAHLRGSVPPRLTLSLTARRGILGTLHELTQSFLSLEVPASEDFMLEVLLAVQEACTNVLRHAYREPCAPGVITFAIEIDADLLRIEVEDEGRPFDPSAVPPPQLDAPREGGFGLYLLRRLMSRVTYSRRGSRNFLVMEKSLAGLLAPGTPR